MQYDASAYIYKSFKSVLKFGEKFYFYLKKHVSSMFSKLLQIFPLQIDVNILIIISSDLSAYLLRIWGLCSFKGKTYWGLCSLGKNVILFCFVFWFFDENVNLSQTVRLCKVHRICLNCFWLHLNLLVN